MGTANVPEWPVLAACIGRDRVPRPAEVDRLADRIWRETHPDGCPWSEVTVGSEQHRFTVAVARAAVGLITGEAATSPPPQLEVDEQMPPPVPEALRHAENAAEDAGSKASRVTIDSVLDDHPLSDGDYSILASFRRDLRGFLRFSERAAEAAGITAQQYQVLLALRASPDRGLSVGDLADQMLLAPHSASGLVSRLETAGLVLRLRPQGDARRVDIQIAKRGADVLSTLAKAHRHELKQLRPMLKDLVARLDASSGGGEADANPMRDVYD